MCVISVNVSTCPVSKLILKEFTRSDLVGLPLRLLHKSDPSAHLHEVYSFRWCQFNGKKLHVCNGFVMTALGLPSVSSPLIIPYIFPLLPALPDSACHCLVSEVCKV